LEQCCRSSWVGAGWTVTSKGRGKSQKMKDESKGQRLEVLLFSFLFSLAFPHLSIRSL
jgi:hypothetical protein